MLDGVGGSAAHLLEDITIKITMTWKMEQTKQATACENVDMHMRSLRG